MGITFTKTCIGPNLYIVVLAHAAEEDRKKIIGEFDNGLACRVYTSLEYSYFGSTYGVYEVRGDEAALCVLRMEAYVAQMNWLMRMLDRPQCVPDIDIDFDVSPEQRDRILAYVQKRLDTTSKQEENR